MCEDFQDRLEQVSLSLEMSPEVGELFGALAKAQAEIESVKKDMVNNHLRQGSGNAYRYSSLTACFEASKPLTANGICVTQIPVSKGNDLSLVTILGHSSGQWIKGALQVPELSQTDKQSKAVNALQVMGVRLTYARRYMLTAMVGLSSDDDTDGEVGSSSSQQGQNHQNGNGQWQGQQTVPPQYQNGNGKPKAETPARPWSPEYIKLALWTKAGYGNATALDIAELENIPDQLQEVLRKKLTEAIIKDENLGPEDVNKIVPDFLEGILGVRKLADIKAPFGPVILKYISLDEDKAREEMLTFMKDQ